MGAEVLAEIGLLALGALQFSLRAGVIVCFFFPEFDDDPTFFAGF